VEEGAERETENEVNGISVGTVWSIGAVEKIVAAVSPIRMDGEDTKKIEITVDSGAGVSCWQEKLLKNTPLMPKVRFNVASGSELKYLGTKKVQSYPVDARRRGGGRSGDVCEMSFHVTDTTKPLAAAMSITKIGNRIVLEDGPSNNCIENLTAGDKVMLRESRGTYVFGAECLEGGYAETRSSKADAR
jgi:hypothetical protein